MTNMTNRINALESELQRCRVASRRQQAAWGALVGVTALALLGAIARQPEPVKPIEELRVQRLCVVDATGKARCVVQVQPDGNCSASWLDADGKPRVSIGCSTDGGELALLDGKGTKRIHATVTESGDALLRWRDIEGAERLEAGTCADGWVRMPDGGVAFQWTTIDADSTGPLDPKDLLPPAP